MIKNLGNYAHPAKARDPLKGRHSAGANPAPGSTFRPRNSASQPEPASNKTKGATKGFGPARNAMTNPTNQAAQAQSQISAQPAPFKNPAGVANAPVPKAPRGAVPGLEPSGIYSNLPTSKAPAHPPKQYQIKTKGLMVGVNFPGKRKVGQMTASSTKGGHSLLYGD